VITEPLQAADQTAKRYVDTSKSSVVVALAGRPNVGKSTLFNSLTGLHQHVGNWPGKTVERKEGYCTSNDRQYKLVDLPGTYSLTANSAEEIIAREYIIRDRPDVVIAMVDAATLERSLYLVAELLPLPAPVVVGLNMVDVAKQEGLEIEPEVLSAALGVPVVPMVAARGEGVHELLEVIGRLVDGEIAYAPKPPRVRADHQQVLQSIRRLISGSVPDPYPEDWVALKLLEGDREITNLMQRSVSEETWGEVCVILRDHDDALVAVAGGRYEWIGRIVRAAVTRPKAGQISLTGRLDRWATHPFWGVLILAAILGVAFLLTFTVGTPLQQFIDTYVIQLLSGLASSWLAGTPMWVSGLVVDGIIAGVGAVVTFLPILVIFFAVMSILEDIGYMARAAYVMDGFMHLMGLHGKSFLPLFLGFGCNVPAILGTRVIESRRARLLTILIAPLVPCTARMAVLAFLAPAFFGSSAMVVSWGLVLMALVVMAISGLVLNKLLFHGERAAFIMELPLYHVPNWRTIGLLVWQRSLAFLQKAGTVTLGAAIVVWALSRLPSGDVGSSYLAAIGHWLEPVGQYVGLDWRLIVALLASFVAKENSIATLGVIFGSGEGIGLAATMAEIYSTATGLAFLVIEVLFIPCAATVAVIKQETGSWRWVLFDLAFLLVVSLAAGAAVYWLTLLVGL